SETAAVQLAVYLVNNGWSPQDVNALLTQAYSGPKPQLINQFLLNGRIVDATHAIEQAIVPNGPSATDLIYGTPDGSWVRTTVAQDSGIAVVRRTVVYWGDDGVTIETPSQNGVANTG